MTIESLILLAGALFGLYRIYRALVTGDASETGGIRRDERPILYWSLMAAAGLIVGVFFYFAAFGEY
jgi:hypothetical protein